MENQIQKEHSKDCVSGWTDNDKKKIASVIFPLIEMQKAYGRTLDTKLVMQGWEMTLADRYNSDQICYALKEYALRGGDDFPSPKNINDILNPESPKVSEAEYVNACKTWEINNYPIFSEELDVINAYKAQNETKRRDFVIENEKIASLVRKSIRKM